MANDVRISVTADTGQAKGALEGLRGAMFSLNQGMELAQNVSRTLGDAYNALVGDTMKYALATRQVMRISGEGAEQSSKLIKLTEDLGISTSVLGTAMKFMAKNGAEPSVESLAKLSDEFLKIEDPAKRDQFLLKEFGKSGFEMAKAMEQGGDALRALGDEIPKNLLLTDEQVKKAGELRRVTVELKDEYETLKNEIGNALIPVLVTAATAFQTLITANQTYIDLLNTHNKDVFEASKNYDDYANEMTRAAQVAGFMVVKQGDQVSVMKLLGNGMMEAVDGFHILTQAEWENKAVNDQEVQRWHAHQLAIQDTKTSADHLSSGIDALAMHYQIAAQAIKDKYNDTLAESAGLQDKLKAAQGELATAQANYTANLAGQAKSALDGYNLSSDKRLKGEEALDKAFGTNYKNLDLQQQAIDAATKAFASGKTTQEEYGKALQDIHDKFMPFDQSVKDATDKVWYLNYQLADVRRRIDDLNGRTVNIGVKYTENGPRPGTLPSVGGPAPVLEPSGTRPSKPTGSKTPVATGGMFVVPPGYNESYPVGPFRATSGEPVVVFPKNQPPMPPIVINVNGAGDPNAVAMAVALILSRKLKAGFGYAGK